MGIERLDTPDSIERLIEADLANGSHETFDGVVESIKTRSNSEQDILAISGLELGYVQIDIGVGDEVVHRLELSRFKLEGSGPLARNLSVWCVDAMGNPTSDTCTLTSAEGGQAYLYGSSLGSIEGCDLKIRSVQLAGCLMDALTGLNDHNWALIVSDRNVPDGEI
jgi:hypothetical protein